MNKMRVVILVFFVSISWFAFSQSEVKIEMGDAAIDFNLKTIEGEKIRLSDVNNGHPLVLIVLRGWPEYQCPVCSRQVGQFLGEAEIFNKLGTKLIFVYPGPSGILLQKGKEFAADFAFSDGFHFVLDPDYSMTNKYGLRWDAPKETAYPSTFVMDKKGKVVYAKVSSTHGGRANVNEILEVLEEL